MRRREPQPDNDSLHWWPDLSNRARDTERMDSLESDQVQLINTLKQFHAINRWLTPCHRLMKRHFLSVMKRDRQRRWSLLDVGSGGGDLPIWIVQQCRKFGIQLDVTCMDYDPRAIDFLKQKCSPFANISVVHADARDLSASEKTWDFVFANHFLHHLSDDDLISVLAAIDRVTTTTYVLSDLYRSRPSYLAYSALLPLLVTNSFTWYDGRISIRKAFTLSDANGFIKAAGLKGKASVRRFFPGHLAMVGDCRVRVDASTGNQLHEKNLQRSSNCNSSADSITE
jgi:2-polyprenyl-3-methyl-5-hydroxy-6-metoxy-1,4-benzoquinol methylase